MTAAKRILVVLLPLVVAGAGYLAARPLARLNDTVALADMVAADTRDPADEPPFEVQAFYRAADRTPESLEAEAQTVEARFRVGMVVFGAWVGLVAAIRIAAHRRVPRRTTYEIDHGICVSCGRCFAACPLEHARRKARRAGRASTVPQQGTATTGGSAA